MFLQIALTEGSKYTLTSDRVIQYHLFAGNKMTLLMITFCSHKFE